MNINLDSVDSKLTPGQLIKSARKEKNISLNDIAQRLLLSKSIITALEADDYSRIPAQVYAEGYLRAYAQVLDISTDTIIESFRRLNIYPSSDEIKSMFKNNHEKINSFNMSKLLRVQKVRWIFWGVFGVILLGSITIITIRFVADNSNDVALEVPESTVITEQDSFEEPTIIIKDVASGEIINEEVSDSSIKIDIPLNLRPKNSINKK